MRIDFEYSKWADQSDRKRAFADMTFNSAMHCELDRMSNCRELAKIGQKHERESRLGHTGSIDLIDMLHALSLMESVIGVSELIDETYTRPDNIRFARNLSVGDCNSPTDAVKLLGDFRRLTDRIIVERTGVKPDDEDMKRILDSAASTTETRESVFEFHVNGMSSFLYAMNVIHATAVQMLEIVGADADGDRQSKKFAQRVEIEHRELVDEDSTADMLVREEERFASTKALARLAMTVGRIGFDDDQLELFKAVEYLTGIYRTGEEIDFFHGNTTDYKDVMDLIGVNCTSNLDARHLIGKHCNLAHKHIADRAKNGVGVFDDALSESELRHILELEANADDLSDQVGNREMLGVTNFLYTEVIVYAATNIIVGPPPEPVEHIEREDKRRSGKKKSRLKTVAR